MICVVVESSLGQAPLSLGSGWPGILARALTAIMGEQPHGTTITRVWEAMKDLSGPGLEERTRQVSPKQPKKQILTMDLETATGLLENRYCHLDLLEESTVSAGGVTPVVTQPTAGTA